MTPLKLIYLFRKGDTKMTIAFDFHFLMEAHPNTVSPFSITHNDPLFPLAMSRMLELLE